MSSTLALPAGPRPLRAVRPPDAPWAAVLAQADDGGRCLLVDSADVEGAIAWSGAGAEHLAAATDLVRTPAGVAAVLPVCVQPLAAFLSRRTGGAPLGAGEIVTLAVSLVRGAAEALSLGPEQPCGEWWLDDSGRPMLVGGGDSGAAHTAAEAVREMRGGADPALSAALELAADVLADPRRVPQEVTDVEAALFAAARAEPVATSILAMPDLRRVPMETGGLTATKAKTRWRDAVVENVDAGLGELVSRVVTAVWRRARADRPPTGRRKHPLIAAGVAGALVLGAGLLWPRGGEDPAVAEPRHPSPTVTHPSESPSRSPSPSASTTATAPRELVDVVGDLLDRRAECPTTACRAATQEDPDAHFTADVTAAEQREVVLLDDFGGAAVVRLTEDGLPDRFVVVVQQDGKWLLRDIRDVAEQPKG